MFGDDNFAILVLLVAMRLGASTPASGSVEYTGSRLAGQRMSEARADT